MGGAATPDGPDGRRLPAGLGGLGSQCIDNLPMLRKWARATATLGADILLRASPEILGYEPVELPEHQAAVEPPRSLTLRPPNSTLPDSLADLGWWVSRCPQTPSMPAEIARSGRPKALGS